MARFACCFALACLFACADEPVDTSVHASGLVRHAGAIPNEYIVVLDGTAAIDRLAEARGAVIHTRYSVALRGFAATMTEEAALALAGEPGVAFVEQDGEAHVEVVQSQPTWGLDRVDQSALPLDARYLQLAQGAGATVYIIDTGIRTSHAEFAGRMRPGFTAIADGRGTLDCNGHGTHVAGTAAGSTYGVAKLASIVPVRVFDCTGGGSTAGVIQGVDFVAAMRTPASVANMSIGGPPSPALDAAVRNAIGTGVTMVVSAGNDAVDACGQSPAREPLAIAVGSTTMTDARSTFSNFGPCVDINAPGSAITSAAFDSDTGTSIKNGTSMASPHVAGAAALYLGQNPTALPAAVASAPVAGATSDRLTDVRGSPNLLLDTRFVDQIPPVTAIAAPANGAQVLPPFEITVTATDPNLDTVAVFVDEVSLGQLTAPPFTFDPGMLALGRHAIVVTATDLGGRSSTARADIEVVAPPDAGCCSGGGGAASGVLALLMFLCLRGRRGR